MDDDPLCISEHLEAVDRLARRIFLGVIVLCVVGVVWWWL